MEDAARFAAAWKALCEVAGLPGLDAAGEDLLRAYREPHRRYHDVTHIVFVLGEIERRAAVVEDRALLGFAAFYHDAVYDPLAKDNEERSAIWAQRDLSAVSSRLAEPVARLIRKTASHHAGDASPDEALFLDMDFSILGAPQDVYARYADAVRAEYAAVPDEAFRTGRAAFLKGVVAQPRMFRTALYEAECAAAARANIAWELKRLEA